MCEAKPTPLRGYIQPRVRVSTSLWEGWPGQIFDLVFSGLTNYISGVNATLSGGLHPSTSPHIQWTGRVNKLILGSREPI